MTVTDGRTTINITGTEAAYVALADELATTYLGERLDNLDAGDATGAFIALVDAARNPVIYGAPVSGVPVATFIGYGATVEIVVDPAGTADDLYTWAR